MVFYRIRVTVDYWNHNVHYHPFVLSAVPAGCAAALDVGCGDGLLVRKLAARARRVTGVDRCPEMIRLAHKHSGHLGNVDFLVADFLSAARSRLPADGYDFISTVATVHHLDFEAATAAMARLLAPGGRLVIIGLAADRTPVDRLLSAAGVPAAGLLALRRGGEGGPEGMPLAEPDMSWSELRGAARRALPGGRFRRRLLWRYSLVWEKPR